MRKEKGIVILDMDKTLLRGIPFLEHMRREIERKPFGKAFVRVARVLWGVGVRTHSQKLRKAALDVFDRIIRAPVPLSTEEFNVAVLKLVNHLARDGWKIRIVSSAPPEAYLAARWVLELAANVEYVHAPTIQDKLKEIERIASKHSNVIVLDDEILGGEEELARKVQKLRDAIRRKILDERTLKEIGVHATSVLERWRKER